MRDETSIRPYAPGDAAAVRELFVLVNRRLAPPDMHAAFERYIDGALAAEIDRVEAYYAEHGGGFWVAVGGGRLAGMFGLEEAGLDAMELRRMYVHPDLRGAGIGSRMLRAAEIACRRAGRRRMVLSTSELQAAAIRLYEANGYRRTAEAVATTASHKTVGGGIRRWHFAKDLAEDLGAPAA